MPDDATQIERAITISESAVRRIEEIRTAEGNELLLLRVAVDGGGCSGFQYGFSLDEAVGDEDKIFEAGSVKVVVDETSLDLLAGSEVDFVEELGGSFFSMRNPNAASTCGCGSSFAI
jgi:iron-sulfur cluster insertion protein